MGKRLITVKNLFEYIQDKELVVQADMIITPGAKDMIRGEIRKDLWHIKLCIGK